MEEICTKSAQNPKPIAQMHKAALQTVCGLRCWASVLPIVACLFIRFLIHLCFNQHLQIYHSL
jgi:hypothetical protein